jgi:hypothetical protein
LTPREQQWPLRRTVFIVSMRHAKDVCDSPFVTAEVRVFIQTLQVLFCVMAERLN